MDRAWRSLHHLATWHVRSAEGSRVNALCASNALAGQRRERDDVDDFLAMYIASWETRHAARRHSA